MNAPFREKSAGEGESGDDKPGDDLQRAPVLEQRGAEPGGARAERDEHRSEANDERSGGRHDPSRLGAQLVEADTGDEREVAGNQR